MSDRRLVPVDEGWLEVDLTGAGLPVLVLQTALDAGELRPLCASLAERGGMEVVHVHRRGYAASSASPALPSVIGDAADVGAVIHALDLSPAHVVGVSYSAAVALSLAANDPAVVRTLTVVEPPPVGTPDAPEFLAANQRLLHARDARGLHAAVTELMTLLAGDDWRTAGERDRPGSVAEIELGAAPFLDADVPSLLAWRFERSDARRIRCPVLHVGGSETSVWFTQMRDRLLDLLPHASAEIVTGAGHLLASTHPAELSGLVAEHVGLTR